ncbi:MAG: alpha/beta hydrolase [Trueperaceae bacterium]
MKALNFEHVFEQGTLPLTILALHGTGGNEHDLVPMARMVAPHANVLSPRGKISEGGALRFFKRIAEGVFDIEDLKFRTHELADFVSAASREYDFDIRKVYALGFSNGANIASSLFFLRPDVLAGGAILRGMVPLDKDKGELEQLPDLMGKKVFLANGTRDPIVPLDNAKRLAAMFKEAGANVTHELNPASHGLIQSDLQTMQRWFTALNV